MSTVLIYFINFGIVFACVALRAALVKQGRLTPLGQRLVRALHLNTSLSRPLFYLSGLIIWACTLLFIGERTSAAQIYGLSLCLLCMTLNNLGALQRDQGEP